MAGYVFAIGDVNPLEAIHSCAEKGVYSTRMNSIAAIPFEGTLADYASMKPGDNIYFFSKRKYYGIGELISVGPDCKYCNYPGASVRKVPSYSEIERDLLVDYGEESPRYRWICTFRGAPYLFEDGIDTDEILTYKPNTFRMLRAFWKVSFIKLNDEENSSLREIFLLRHQEMLSTGERAIPVAQTAHEGIAGRDLTNYRIAPAEMLASCAEGTRIKHEMAVEAAVVYDLSEDRIPELGHWDYVSHQVVASPFKPIDYMDKIDVFAYRYLPDTKIPCKYLVAELKKDEADRETIDQVLKYVDWVCQEYAYGDYSAIEACIIAHEFAADISDYFEEVVRRNYTLGSHPVRNNVWKSLKLLRYSYEKGEMKYIDETPLLSGEDK